MSPHSVEVYFPAQQPSQIGQKYHPKRTESFETISIFSAFGKGNVPTWVGQFFFVGKFVSNLKNWKLFAIPGSKLKTWNLWLCMNHSYRSPRHSMMYYDVIWVCQATNRPKRHWTFCWFQRESNGSLVFKVPNFKNSHRQFKTPCSSFSSMKSFNDFSHSWCLLHRKHSW